MISVESKFKIVKRGFKDIMILVPGWATDYRIFNTLDLNYNYLLPIDLNPFDFKDRLSEFLKASSIDHVSLFGWSQGGFIASGFASDNPGKIDELILSSIRKRYDKKFLEDIGFKVKKNKRAFLYKFYLDCFSPGDNPGLDWFKENLLKQYLDDMSVECLIEGLEYLSNAEMNHGSLSGVRKIRIFHGAEDRIAPLEEALEIKSSLAHAEFICMNGTGHLLFLNTDFKERING